MSAERVAILLKEQPGLTAREIADKLGLDRKDVNAYLHGALRNNFIQDKSYRWWPKDAVKEIEPRRETDKSKRDTPLARLSRYYLECLSQDSEVGISVFASSKHDLDYAPLSSLPILDESVFLFEDAESKRLLNKTRRDRYRLTLYVGYPIRLRLHRARSGWEGFFVEPVFLLPFKWDSENSHGHPDLSDDQPQFNFKVLSSLRSTDSGNVMDEAIHLADALGLASVSEDAPELDELFLKLESVRPEWDWRERLDPYRLSNGKSLGELTEQGIYNRAILVAGDRSPYTQGLETELSNFERLDESDYANTALGMWLKGNEIEIPAAAETPLIEVLPLNSEQRQAVAQGLQNSLTVITGPPGTGKSQVVTSLLINAAWRGMKVLFASKNNKAVDVVEARVNALGPRPVLLRLGRNEYQSRLAEYLLALLAATASQEDEANYLFHQQEHDRLRQCFDVLQTEMDDLVSLRNQVDQLDQRVDSARGVFETERFAALKEWDIDRNSAKLRALSSVLKATDRDKQSFIIRLFWNFCNKGRFERLQREVMEVKNLVDQLGVSTPSCQPNDLTLKLWQEFGTQFFERMNLAEGIADYFKKLLQLKTSKSLEAIAREYADLIDQLSDTSERVWQSWLRLQPNRMNKEERRLLSEYASLLQMINAANQNKQSVGRKVFQKYYSLFPKIVESLPCWAVTSLSARGKIPFEPGFFDLVVIDEASQCDIASALPLAFRARHAVIIGDPKQLRHISAIGPQQDRQLLEKHELVEDRATWAYSVNSLFDLGRSLCRAEDIVVLRDHHRSHADIIGFSNEIFYEGRLRIATRYDKLKLPNQTEPAVRWLDVKGRVVRPPTGGAVNEEEGKAVVAEIRRLVVEAGYPGTIGVVSPFRAQANRIRDLVYKDETLSKHLSAADFLADTVHRFQGDERDVMIFSPVVSSGIGKGALYFLKNNGNLFNVAITRARSALIAVGDHAAVRHSDIDYLARFANYATTLKPDETQDIVSVADLGPEYPSIARPDLVSDWERIFYSALYAAGICPIPQYDVEQYILDFAIFAGDRRLNVEVDGERYHRNWDGELCRRDQIRNQRLIELGWDVMRFWVYQIRDDMNESVAKVAAWAERTNRS